MVTARLLALAIHPLLVDHPAAVIGDNEAVKVKLKAVLHRGAVDLGYEPADGCKLFSIETDTLADRDQFVRRFPRMLAAPAANMNSEFLLKRSQSALQRSDHARGDACGMPVHAHHATE